MKQTFVVAKLKTLFAKSFVVLKTTKNWLKNNGWFPKAELPEIPEADKGLTDLVESDYPFAIDPMPNLYFTRDPFATIGNAVSLNHMYADTRNRETLYGKYIFKYHPVYGGKVELGLQP